MTTICIVAESPLPPESILAAARDFSPRREAIFDAVSMERMEVHALGEETADVTEGTRAGVLGVNWERCDYDWSQPGCERHRSRTRTSTSRKTRAGRSPPCRRAAEAASR